MKSIRAIAECLYKNEFNLLRPIEFCESVLAAYLAQQDPVGTVRVGRDFMYRTDYFDDLPTGKHALYLTPPIKPGFVMVPENAIAEAYRAGELAMRERAASAVMNCDEWVLRDDSAKIILDLPIEGVE
jgi:hypothetical protein